MQVAAIAFDRFKPLQDDACDERILAAKAALGKRAVILGHHYQRADVYKHADLTGDSLKLSKLASQTSADYLVFCGVHFMAEVADILSKPEQTVILPDMNAGCSMADMANAWRRSSARGGSSPKCWIPTQKSRRDDVYQFGGRSEGLCGEHGGIVCTSSNAKQILEWSFARRAKVLFFPDQHLGRWSGYMIVFRPTRCWCGFRRAARRAHSEQIRKAKVLLWKGTARCIRCSRCSMC
jgi:quinolinate synthase